MRGPARFIIPASARRVTDDRTIGRSTNACNSTRSKWAAAAQIAEAKGALSILVNNAGWDVFRLFKDSTPDEWQKLIAINLVGAAIFLGLAIWTLVELLV